MLVLLFRAFTAEPHGVLHLLAADVAELPLDGSPACEIRNLKVEKLFFFWEIKCLHLSDHAWATGFLTSVAATLTQGSVTVFRHFSWTMKLHTGRGNEGEEKKHVNFPHIIV